MGDEMDGRAKVTRVSSAIDLDLTGMVEETARLVMGSVSQAVAEIVVPHLVQIDQRVRLLAGLLQSAALSEEQTADGITTLLPEGHLNGTLSREQVGATLAERLYAAGYALVPISGAALEQQAQDDNPGGNCMTGVPCPPFEDVRLEISPEPPEPGAFARAAMGDEWTERTTAGYAAKRAAHETLAQELGLEFRGRVESLLDSGVPAAGGDDLADWASSLRPGTSESGIPVLAVDLPDYMGADAQRRADERLAQARRDPEDSWREPDQQ